MDASTVTLIFAFFVVASLLTRLWLDGRQTRHVARHRDAVPPAFAQDVSLSSHQRAANYTLDKLRFGLVNTAVSTAVLLGWTLLGGLGWLNGVVREAVYPEWGGLAYQLVLVGAFLLIGGLIELPLDAWNTFRIEQRHGFNRMSWGTWLGDQFKGVLVGVLLGGPIAALILWLMGAAGDLWWLWAWAAWVAFSLLLMVIFPLFIAPLFNKFEPLKDTYLAERVQALMQRCGFQSKGLFVMDGSRRSAHANAYFTGLGRAKRVVFFDTLLAKLSHGEVEAVLAHELGHFKHRHVLKRMVMMFGISLAGFALLGWLSNQVGFYQGLGVMPNLQAPNDALALLLFMLALPPVMFFVAPVFSALSRRDEYEADTYACQQASGHDLAMALIKLYKDNSSTLTPDPLYVRFYYSHPPAIERLAAMKAQAAPT
ncbi:M48 family metalloprotease [Aquabacterium fontiphilum]|jgi:STE24 endopeptidase|uniref:M48 family metallopeptidase n=1 Tax=Aquabacterium fontiphilum TaxID=450365 RepID=UPI0013766513|nr:M48 family metallopeptidase [Aquabacterium fontiphilum]NBD19651.1 M48 family metalloprotease [Aquabacterium fontiphilum]